MRKLFYLLFLITGLASCYQTTSEPEFDMALVLPPDSMVFLLADLHMADAYVESIKDKKISKEHMASEYFNIILDGHRIDRQTFDESMRYYSYHTEEMDDIYEKVIVELSKRESKLISSKEEEKEEAEEKGEEEEKKP
jgi:hypothetical protein